jgi:hypothetical protein
VPCHGCKGIRVNRARLRAATTRILLVALLLAGSLTALSSAAGAEDLARENPDAAQELAERYAPVIVLKAQDGACDPDGEPYAPTSVDIVLDNPEVLLRQLGNENPVLLRSPGASDLFGLGEGFFLDFPGSALDPGCIYETDFNRYGEGLPVTVYAHIVQEDDHPDQLALQYWIYWYYNDWNNKHESDWEGIQLLFEASSIEEALTSEPVSVGYAQHEGGERAGWDSSKLEREGSHPVVYPSAGSHASYYSSALYMGRSASEGFGCDNTDGPSDRFDSAVTVLPDAAEDADDPLAWLAYEGRWGERQSGPFNGPTGPLAKGRWLEPISWHAELRASSVVIPSGDSFGEQVIGVFCSTVEFGSSQLILATTSPVRLLVSALLVGMFVRWLVGRTDWGAVAGSPLVRRRRAGQIIRAAYRKYRRSWRALVPFGAVYVPAMFVAGLLGAFLALLPLLGDILDLAGDNSGTNVVAAVTAGGLPQLVAAVAVNAMVAAYLGAPEAERSAREAVRLAWESRRQLLAITLRGFFIVAALVVTVVGIPWGIRQLVRYQFAAQALILEGADGRAALARSSTLVRGRWWHTAVMVAAFNALPFVTALVVGLLLLLGLSGLPIWLFSALMTLIYGVLVPLAATAQTMLYGDAVAEYNERDEAGAPVSVGAAD